MWGSYKEEYFPNGIFIIVFLFIIGGFVMNHLYKCPSCGALQTSDEGLALNPKTCLKCSEILK